MRARAPILALFVVALTTLGACQSPDVGQPCTITWGTGSTEPPPDPVTLYKEGGSDWFESGNTQCENLVCIVSPAAPGSQYSGGGYCSKPCVSNQDCFQSETGLVCRQLVLDPAFLKALDTLDPALRQKYLGDIQFSSYCVVAR
ncbi:MAG TPA: adventurous gliding motility lipoprotein CglC [Anaeromyxobacter sp.]